MPPKGVRRGRGAGETAARGGRAGRGRGRGGSAAAQPPPPPAEVNNDQDGSQSTIVDSPMPDVEPAANTTPVHQPDQFDPNSSPATQPTETPAPTPARPPPSVPTRGSATHSGSASTETAAPKPSKFKPRIVRANAKEREEREKREQDKEEERMSVIQAAAAKQARFLARSRGRGRGAAMGRGRGAPSGIASGPFAAVASGDKKGFFSVKRETGGGPSAREDKGPNVIKRESGSGVTGGNYAGGFGRGVAGERSMADPEYPGDENDDSPRIDIQNINIASDDDDDPDVIITGSRRVKGKAKAYKGGGQKPIWIDRKEHKERVTVVNTDTTIKSEPGNLNDPDAMAIDDDERPPKAAPPHRPWVGTYEEDAQIKWEPGVEIGLNHAPPSSPPARPFKVPNEVGDDDPAIQTPAPKTVSPRPERRVKSGLTHRKKDKTPVLQTEEDRAEWERYLEDLDILRSELTGLAHKDQQNRDEGAEGDDKKNGPQKEGRIYLFQFPPVLPKLYDQTVASNPNPNGVKFDSDIEMADTVDLTKEKNPEVKTEEKVTEIKQEEFDPNEEERKRRARESLVVEDGLIGRLVVRRSGKVELVWGGTNMKVSRGMETSFFGAGAVVDNMGKWIRDEKGNDIAASQESKGRSTSMGDIMGKFVVTPDWRAALR